MEHIVLKSGMLEVTKVIKKTQAKGFKDLKVGDCVWMAVPVKAPGVSRGIYATYVSVHFVRNNETVLKSFNELSPILRNFEFKEVPYVWNGTN